MADSSAANSASSSAAALPGINGVISSVTIEAINQGLKSSESTTASNTSPAATSRRFAR